MRIGISSRSIFRKSPSIWGPNCPRSRFSISREARYSLYSQRNNDLWRREGGDSRCAASSVQRRSRRSKKLAHWCHIWDDAKILRSAACHDWPDA